jgi:uncharacterized UPF0160 family protein
MQKSLKKIGTHSGSFHVDEVLGCTMLTKYTKEYKDAEITRTRDEKVLATLDLVIDVGGVYDFSKGRLDHHQKEFQEAITPERTIRLSSAGLVYKHFGKEVVRTIAEHYLNFYKLDFPLTESLMEKLYWKIYDNFIESIDGIDNGINQYPLEIKPKYVINTHLGARVARLNPSSNEGDIPPDERFQDAMKIVDEELNAQIKGLVLNWIPARTIVEKSYGDRLNTHSSGEIMRLEKPCAWKDHLYEIEKETNTVGNTKFVLFKDTAGAEGWRVQAVSLDQGSFSNRKSLHADWRGKHKDIIAKESGIEDVVFCHASGFIGGAASYESTLKMADLSLKFQEKMEIQP